MSSDADYNNTNINRGWSQLYKLLRTLHGGAIVKDVRKLESIYKHQIQQQCNAIFLKKCQESHILPKRLSAKFLTNQFGRSSHIQRLEELTQFKLIRALIKSNYQDMYERDKSIRSLRTKIRELVPQYWSWICRLINTTRHTTEMIIKTRHMKKFDNLMMSTITNTTISIQEEEIKDVIHNLSSHELTEEEVKLLRLGLNFSLPVKDVRICMMDTAATIELKMIYDLKIDDHEKDQVRSGVSQIMKSHVNKSNYLNKWEKWITSSIRSLINSKEICICKADKGNAVVILNRSDYKTKMENMIIDGPYSIINDPTEMLSKSVELACQKLLTEEKLTKGEIDKLIEKNIRAPIIYGAPKIHKAGVPLRPVVDFRHSPTYQIAAKLSSGR